MGQRLAIAILLLWSIGSLLAQPNAPAAASPRLEVRDVDFNRVRDRAGDEWWEATVNLRVTAARGEAGRFAERVRVGLNLAYQRPTGARELVFYRAAVTAPVLEAGNHAFRFYLPPAVVRRDRLTAGARFWTVDLSLDGRALTGAGEQVSPDFSSPAAVENFRTQLRQNAPDNDGVLLPWHYTPWVWTASDTDPAIIRPEAVGVAR